MRAALSALLILLPLTALANKAGIAGYSGKTTGTTCGACHSGGTKPTASISNVPTTLNVLSSATVTVTVTAGSMASTVTGLDVAFGGVGAPGSTFSAGQGTQVLTGELTHLAPQPFDAGIAAFTFNITAGGTDGALTIYVATVAGNNDNADTGDEFYLFNRTLQIVGDAGTPTPDAGPPLDDGGTPPVGNDGGGPVGPPPAVGHPGGFVDGSYGCSTGATSTGSGAWLLALGTLAILIQRRSTKRT